MMFLPMVVVSTVISEVARLFRHECVSIEYFSYSHPSAHFLRRVEQHVERTEGVAQGFFQSS